MNKLIYACGVYFICVRIHEGLEALDGYLAMKHREREDMKFNKKKGPIGIQSDPAHKPINKIGFVID